MTATGDVLSRRALNRALLERQDVTAVTAEAAGLLAFAAPEAETHDVRFTPSDRPQRPRRRSRLRPPAGAVRHLAAAGSRYGSLPA